jgi:aminocarboxymuconate-semialdehyde decarboxylase
LVAGQGFDGGLGLRVDIHSHLAPSGYVNRLTKLKKPPRIISLSDGSMQLDCGDGLSYPIGSKMVSIEPRVKEMEESGIDRQVLSLPLPGTDFFERDYASKLAQLANDELSEISKASRGRFSAAANVPLRYPDIAIKELHRCVEQLEMTMVEAFSNVAGEPLDSERFFPFYKELARLKIPLLIHPGRPLMMDNLREYGLAGAVGYLFDTTLAILRIVYSGLLERLPDVRIILPHTGSTIPYLVGRIDHQYTLLDHEQRKLANPPSEYLKKVYVDTAQSLYRPATECAFNFTPHERILFGSDYPFVNLKQSVAIVKSLSLSKGDEDRIFSENAKSLGII